MLNIAHMVVIKPQSGTHVAPIDLKLMEMEQFARFTLEKEILNRIRGRLTAEQEAAYRLNLESYRQLERDPDAENRETRMLDLDNAFHRRAFELCGMEEHFDHMLSTFQHIERLRKFSLQTEENKSVCAAHTRILEAVLRGSEEDLSRALSDHLNRYKLSVEQARQQGRKGLVLTCKEHLLHFYGKVGFVDEGISDSTHGGAVWHKMRLTF